MYFLPFPVQVICVGRGFEKLFEFVDEFFKRWRLFSVLHECEEGSFCSAFCLSPYQSTMSGVLASVIWCLDRYRSTDRSHRFSLSGLRSSPSPLTLAGAGILGGSILAGGGSAIVTVSGSGGGGGAGPGL